MRINIAIMLTAVNIPIISFDIFMPPILYLNDLFYSMRYIPEKNGYYFAKYEIHYRLE